MTDLPGGGIEGHLALPDLVQLGLAGRVLHEVHLFPILGNHEQGVPAPQHELTGQQLVGQLFVPLVALV